MKFPALFLGYNNHCLAEFIRPAENGSEDEFEIVDEWSTSLNNIDVINQTLPISLDEAAEILRGLLKQI